ncbi:hypothetical protein MSAN_00217700 [Mycena sanguinolenta]|uniref:Ubiquitin-like domain-containing protein n=1 Tax=Mycena sanguinolenta TaxID=230812 RepID=A0A8H7DML9_9AGAR|nr:hypothetical protein MSAN_00217700 [Mycena sanguinolenta]
MAKTKTSTVHEGPQESLFVLTDGRKRVLVIRPKTHKAAVDTARRHFPWIKAEDLIFQTDQLEICNRTMTDISPESWEAVVPQVSSVFVVERHGVHQGGDASPRTNATHATDQSSRALVMKMKATTPFRKASHLISTQLVLDDFDMVYDGCRLRLDQTPADVDMEDQDSIDIILKQRGGKPVIYVYSPTETDVSVALTLTREWSLSAIYPVVSTKALPSGTGERIQWNVRTRSNGSLTELNTGLDVAYLFWEAHTNHGIPASPPTSPVAGSFPTTQSFSPLTSDLFPVDSVLIAVRDITPYLDKVLAGLALHTEARTSFITYWLPSLLKHKHVALRFVPQEAYEIAAPLDIQPVPEVVTRIFMLFKGIDDDALTEWENAKAAADDTERWKEVVGGDFERADDASLFRVLEWGGMEVLAR